MKFKLLFTFIEIYHYRYIYWLKNFLCFANNKMRHCRDENIFPLLIILWQNENVTKGYNDKVD